MEKLKQDVYENPKIEIINLGSLDIITTSNPIDDSLPDDTWQS